MVGKSLASVVLVLLGLLVSQKLTAQPPFQLEAGFVRLDNGEDLEGWYVKGQDKILGWRVADGAIHLEAAKANGNLHSKQTHSTNCIIRLQFRATDNADSGVYIHGKQLQVRDYRKAGPRLYAPAAKPAGEWNELEFDIVNGLATVRLNGKLIEQNWRTGPDPNLGIGLQRERGDFDFRYIRIKERRND